MRKSGTVDCRECVFFVPLTKCDRYQARRAYETVLLRGKKIVLGYCVRYFKGISHYFRKCYGFKPKNTQKNLVVIFKAR